MYRIRTQDDALPAPALPTLRRAMPGAYGGGFQSELNPGLTARAGTVQGSSRPVRAGAIREMIPRPRFGGLSEEAAHGAAPRALKASGRPLDRLSLVSRALVSA